MKLKSLASWLVAGAAGISMGLLIRNWSANRTAASLPPPQWSVDQGIEEAAGYLVRVTDNDGRFVYLMAVDGGAAPGYNVVRHAGAIYALSDFQTQGKTPEARAQAAAATERASERLLRTYTRPPKGHPDMLAVWSDPKEEGGGKWSAKLGGTALGMVGLLGRARALDGGADLSTPQKLAKFALYMQKPNGDFNSKYTESDGIIAGESLYYPGETILGLAMLYELDHDPAWLDAGLRGIAARIAALKDSTDLPADHWLLIAIDRLLPLMADAKTPAVTRDEMLGFAIKLAQSMIDGQTRVHKHRPELDGCYTDDGRTTPSATRLEGLLALEHAIRGDAKYADFHAELTRSIVSGMTFLRRSQITSGPRQGGFPASVKPNDDRAHKDESEDEKSARRGEVRVDFVQHALSAMMHFRELCAAAPATCAR